MVDARPWPAAGDADALLAEHGRIVALGRAEDLRARAPHARVVSAAGGTLTPGLTDAHLHLVPWARGRRQPDLHDAPTRAEALERVRVALAALPPGDAPLVGRGWDDAAWEAPPEIGLLDALAPTRPVLLHRRDFHTLWVNRAALRAAGVTRDTPDPEGGRFERDAAGEPNGLVRENAVARFAALEDSSAPRVDDELLDAAATALHAQGITGVHDYQRNVVDWERMRALAGRHRLRVLQQVGPEQVRDHARLGIRPLGGDDWFRTGSLKLFADGTLGSRTAWMLAPFDDAPGTGMALLSPRELDEAFELATSAGFSVTVHAIGDGAVRATLDACERHREALARCVLPVRIEHVQLLHDDDLPRLVALGVAASMQPQHAVSDAPVARRAWGARCRMAYPLRTLRDAGVTLAFGSDAPVEPPCAALGLAAAVARIGCDGLPFEPGQSITLDDALRAYTSGAAALAGFAFGHGTLQPGEPADLVAWDRDLHACAPPALADARPRFTALAGEIVYESPRVAVPGRGAPA